MFNLLPAPFPILLESLLRPSEFPSWRWRSLFLLRYLRFYSGVSLRPPVRVARPEKLTVVLLSYRRVWNMEPIVKGMLQADFVERVVVSNNNPAYRIRDWVRVNDDRVQLIDQPRPRAVGLRNELARSLPGEYFLSVDDDVFLTPEQLRRLFLALLANPEAPHGVRGENYVSATDAGGENAPWSGELRQLEGRADVVNGVYAYTRRHLEELFRLCAELGIDLAELKNGEDVLLSFTGASRPYLHDLGPLTECLSAHQQSVSIFRSHPNFYAERRGLYERLTRLKVRKAA